MEQQEILEQLKQLNILTRVNNLLLSKFIVQLQTVKRELHLPKIIPFFKFELRDDDYNDLVDKFGKKGVNKALYFLDRQLVDNKMQCPNNIKRYLNAKLIRSMKAKERYKKMKGEHIQDGENQEDSTE